MGFPFPPQKKGRLLLPPASDEQAANGPVELVLYPTDLMGKEALANMIGLYPDFAPLYATPILPPEPLTAVNMLAGHTTNRQVTVDPERVLVPELDGKEPPPDNVE